MTLRILHVLDHSIPLHSGYTFRTLALLREQRRLGWETFHLTSPKHAAPGGLEETVDGWHFHRTPAPTGPRLPGLAEAALMKATQQRLLEVARRVQPHILHAHSPVLDAIPALRVGRELGIPVVYEVRAFWEDAAVDHGTTTEGSLRYRLTRRLETHALRQAAHVFTICEGLRRDIAALAAQLRSVSTKRRPAARSAGHCSRRASRSSTAAASASALPARNSMPVSPWRMSSLCPPTSLATSSRPWAMASSGLSGVTSSVSRMLWRG